MRADRIRTRPAISRALLYTGGLLGPFGAGVVVAMLPELGADFSVSAETAATSLTAYLLPFALVMLVSGTLGERWGPIRTIRTAYAVYAVATVLAVLAGWFWLFQVTRGLQGVANAFTTPLLMSKLAATAPPNQLGRVLGTYGAVQSLGQTSAPLFGGLAAAVDWRLAFLATAVISAVLAVGPLPGDEPRSGTRESGWRDAIGPVVAVAGGTAALTGVGLIGLSFLVSLRLDDLFALEPGTRGVVLTSFGIAGALTARFTGRAADRFGSARTVCAGLMLGAAAVAVLALPGSLPAAAAAWAVAGASSQLVLVGVNTAVLAVAGSSAISVVTSARFLGMATAPALLTPIYAAHPDAGFAVPAALLALLAPLVLHLWPRRG